MTLPLRITGRFAKEIASPLPFACGRSQRDAQQRAVVSCCRRLAPAWIGTAVAAAAVSLFPAAADRKVPRRGSIGWQNLLLDGGRRTAAITGQGSE